MEEPTSWLIRAGESSRHARRFADHGVVALGWPDVDGLGDLRTLTPEDVLLALQLHDPILRPEQDATELLWFRDEVAIGDIVVTPDGPHREVLVGEITGPYEFLDPSPAVDFHHVRTVDWFDVLSRDELPADLASELNYRRTIRRLSDQAEWRSFAEAVRPLRREGAGSTLQRSPRLGTRRDRRAAKAPATRRCPSCWLTKAEAQFIALDHRCVDCR